MPWKLPCSIPKGTTPILLIWLIAYTEGQKEKTCKLAVIHYKFELFKCLQHVLHHWMEYSGERKRHRERERESG